MNSLKIRNRVIKTPLLDIIKDLHNCIHNGKLTTIKLMGQDIRVSCVNPEHKGGHEHNASARVYIGNDTDKLKYGTYHCFTCDIACSFQHFVALTFECSDEKAEEWLIENYADNSVDYEIQLPEFDISPKKKIVLDESILTTYQDFHPYMIQRKLSKRIIELFKIKYDPKTKCLVFPVYDENNNLVMFTKRSVEDKTFIIDKDKEKPLYLLNYIRQHNIQNVMISEGQIDALTACSYGMPCVATMGAISDHQIDLINKSGIRVLYTMFDNDDAGKRFTYKLLGKLNKNIMIIRVPILYKDKKDINDLSEEEFWKCIDSAEKQLIS